MSAWRINFIIMKQFTLPLIEDNSRPILKIENFFNIYAMLDTGAVIPVWIKNETFLKTIGGEIIAYNQPFGGFGGEARGTLYRIPVFRLGDLIYPELPVIASSIDLPCNMLISATMFGGLIYEIDDYHHKFNVTIPDVKSYVRKLEVKDSGGKLHVLCSDGEISEFK